MKCIDCNEEPDLMDDFYRCDKCNNFVCEDCMMLDDETAQVFCWSCNKDNKK